MGLWFLEMKMLTKECSVLAAAFPDSARARLALTDLSRAFFKGNQLGVVTRGEARRKGLVNRLEVKSDLVGYPEVGSKEKSLWDYAVAAGLCESGGWLLAGGLLARTLGNTPRGAKLHALADTLEGFGIDRGDAQFYERQVRKGRSLVLVSAPGRQDEALDILHRCGALSHVSVSTAAPKNSLISSVESGDPPSNADGDRKRPLSRRPLH